MLYTASVITKYYTTRLISSQLTNKLIKNIPINLQDDIGDDDMEEGPHMETAVVLHEVLNGIC